LLSSTKTSSWLCALLYIAAFLPLANVLRQHFGFPLDDSWIHQVIARNLAETHVLGFNPGKLSSGSTSLLWTLILTANTAVLPRLSPVVYCLFISVALLGWIGFSLKRLTEQDDLCGSASWAFAIAPAVSANFLWFGLIGMEHLLFIALSLAWVRIWMSDGPSAGISDRLPLLLLPILLILTRPEGVFLVALSLVAMRLTRRTKRDAFAASLGALCGMALSCAVNWRVSGQLVPATMRGRQFLASPDLHWRWRDRLYFFGQTAVRIAKTWSIQHSQTTLHGAGFVRGVVGALLGGSLLVFAIQRLWMLRAQRLLFLCAWAVAVELLYFVTLPITGHGGRYIAFSMMLCFCLMLFGLQQLIAAFTVRNRVVWLGVAAVAILSYADSLSVWKLATAADIDQINLEHGAMALWLQGNLPQDTFSALQLAAFDIGRIGYQFQGGIVDLGGLVDSRYLPYLLQHRTGVYLREHDVRYVVLPTGTADTGYAGALALDPQHGVTLTLLHTVCADPAIAELAMNSSQTAYPCQRLYAIRYRGVNKAASASLGDSP
jgi:hypothetical protein